jgi:hypothetical protein
MHRTTDRAQVDCWDLVPPASISAMGSATLSAPPFPLPIPFRFFPPNLPDPLLGTYCDVTVLLQKSPPNQIIMPNRNLTPIKIFRTQSGLHGQENAKTIARLPYTSLSWDSSWHDCDQKCQTYRFDRNRRQKTALKVDLKPMNKWFNQVDLTFMVWKLDPKGNAVSQYIRDYTNDTGGYEIDKSTMFGFEGVDLDSVLSGLHRGRF